MLLVLIFKNTISIQLSASTYSLATITDSLDTSYYLLHSYVFDTAKRKKCPRNF